MVQVAVGDEVVARRFEHPDCPLEAIPGRPFLLHSLPVVSLRITYHPTPLVGNK